MNVFELFKEEAAGVGVVANNRQKNDPRYSHSLTVDVSSDTPKKNRKALGLTEATAQEKAAWLKIVQPYAERAAEALETNPKFILDQWALESGYKIPKNNNLGGLTKRGEESGFREYDDLEGYTKDWVNQINKNWPDLKGVETMDDYVDVLQTKGKNGVYAKEEPDTPTYRERLAGMRTGYVPSEEAPTVAVTPAGDNADRKAELQNIIDNNKDRLGGIATQAGRDAYLELQKIKKAEKQASDGSKGTIDAFGNTVTDKGFDPDNKKAQQATNQAARIAKRQSEEDQKRAELEKISKSRGRSVSPALDAERRDIGKDTASTTTKTDTSVTATPAGEESYAEMGKKALPDSLSVKRKELEDAKAQGASQAEIDRLEQAVKFNKAMQAGGLEGAGTLSNDETEYLTAKEAGLLTTSIADLDTNRRAAKAYANQQRKNGNTEIADAADAESDQWEALGTQMLDKGITWGQGTLDQQEQQMKQWDKTKAEGGDPTQSWKGGVITDPTELAGWQKRNQEAIRKQKEQGQWNITKTIDDYSADVSSWGQEIQKAEAEKEPVDMSKAGQAGTDDFMKSGPGTVPEKPAVVTTPTKPEVDDISGDFKTTKQRQHYRDKYSALTPAFMMDEPDKQAVIARERLRNKAGELMRTNPAEWNKLYGGDKLGKAIEKAEQDAYAKFDEPQTTQKPAPIVDKSTTYKPDRNANLANNQIGDAYGVFSEPKSPIGQATVSTTPRAGPGANANTQTFDAEKQKAERQAKIDQQKAERQAKIDQQKAEQAAKKAEQKAKQEARKAEDERKRQERQAEQERRVSGSTQTVGAPAKVGESAIFRAIMRK